jgi:hypothetical protein
VCPCKASRSNQYGFARGADILSYLSLIYRAAIGPVFPPGRTLIYRLHPSSCWWWRWQANSRRSQAQCAHGRRCTRPWCLAPQGAWCVLRPRPSQTLTPMRDATAVCVVQGSSVSRAALLLEGVLSSNFCPNSRCSAAPTAAHSAAWEAALENNVVQSVPISQARPPAHRTPPHRPETQHSHHRWLARHLAIYPKQSSQVAQALR